MTSQALSVLTGTVVEEGVELTLSELCGACGAEVVLIEQLVAHGVVEPSSRGGAPEGWTFAGTSLKRTRTAVRLIRDLDLNLPGAALALDLLDEIERLQRELRLSGRG